MRNRQDENHSCSLERSLSQVRTLLREEPEHRLGSGSRSAKASLGWFRKLSTPGSSNSCGGLSLRPQEQGGTHCRADSASASEGAERSEFPFLRQVPKELESQQSACHCAVSRGSCPEPPHWAGSALGFILHPRMKWHPEASLVHLGGSPAERAGVSA